jgi:CheY-like chemotaxis protein
MAELEKIEKSRVLIIEDEVILMMSLQLMLKKIGFKEIFTAVTGEEAVTRAIELEPDLLLVDICLGVGISGVEAVKKIQSEISVPVVYITGNSDRHNKDLALQTDYSDYLVKPITLNELQRAVVKAVQSNSVLKT